MPTYTPNWRWICCQCLGNNSYTLDVACSLCYYQICDRCEVFDANVTYID